MSTKKWRKFLFCRRNSGIWAKWVCKDIAEARENLNLPYPPHSAVNLPPPLSAAEEEQLSALYASSDNAVERRRSQGLLLSARGHTVTQLTAIFQVCRLTISHWFDGWQSQQLAGLRHRPGQGRQRKLAAVPRADLEELVREHPQNLKAVLAEVEIYSSRSELRK